MTTDMATARRLVANETLRLIVRPEGLVFWGAPSNVLAWSDDQHTGPDARDMADEAYGDGDTDGEAVA